mmetsp:Transcript_70890/g.132606  ORF Transcript_70890/g.132606 Transcript_70890/m.132606 type:complete len:199 (+) Transcript_70890:52-648(+)
MHRTLRASHEARRVLGGFAKRGTTRFVMAALTVAASSAGDVRSFAGVARSPSMSNVLRRVVEPSNSLLVELTPLRKEDIALNSVVFLGMCVPFLYAAFEFWRRIAFGQSFGTGDEVVVFPKGLREEVADGLEEGKRARPIGKAGKVTIGMDADTNRGRVELGTDALIFAYILMFLAAGVVLVSLAALGPIFSGQVAVE